MKLLKIYNRDKTAIKNIANFDYSSIKPGDINSVTIYENPEKYVNKIIEVWDFDKPIYSGILKNYDWDNSNKIANIEIYPLLFDLKRGFLTDPNLSAPGNGIYYKTGHIEVILAEIIGQYINDPSIDNKILSLGELATTGRYTEFTFYYNNYFEALQLLIKKMLPKGYYIDVDVNGVINLVNYENVINLKNNVDIENIDFKKRHDEDIEKIIFDNKRPGSEHILKEYTNPDVQDGAHIYLADSRFKDVAGVDNYIATYLETKGSEKIEVNQIISKVDVPIYSKINIYNWDKNFLELYVTEKEILNNGLFNLKVGNSLEFKDTADDIDILNNTIEVNLKDIRENQETVPEYVKETYIDSVKIKSPEIFGNGGYFSSIFKVGADGVVIDGENKLIRSKNYVTGSSGWRIDNDGNAEFNDATLRGDLVAGTININNKFKVANNGDVEAQNITNKSILFKTIADPYKQDGQVWCGTNGGSGKVLWGYFGNRYEKQQVSTSGMQVSYGADTTRSETKTYNTWFKPRYIIFSGFLQNTGQDKAVNVNGHADYVANTSGACNMTLFEQSSQGFVSDINMNYTNGIVSNLNFTRNNEVDILFNNNGGFDISGKFNEERFLKSASWTNNTVLRSFSYRTSQPYLPIYIGYTSSYFAAVTDSGGGATARVSSWQDNKIEVAFSISSGWRLRGNILIVG